jgi:hypothetical protein
MLKFLNNKNIIPHILYIASYDKSLFINHSINSLTNNGKVFFEATVIFNTPEKKKENYSINSLSKVDIIHSPLHHKEHPPSRWFLDFKSKICLFLDYDIVCLKDIRKLINICNQTNSLCGVLAYKFNIDKNLFKECFKKCGADYIETKETWLDKVSIPRYYNYGVLAMPVHLIYYMRNELQENINIINDLATSLNDTQLKKHAGQIALSITIEKLKVPTTDLDISYNCPDIAPEHAFKTNSVVFWHNLKKNKLFLPFK